MAETTPSLQNVIILLLGFPGTGKLTIAKELCALYDFKLIDNQTINAPLFKMLDLDGKTPIPQLAWYGICKIRQIVFEIFEYLPSPTSNFVFTYYGCNEWASDYDGYKEYESAAKKRSALFVPVRLTISEAENKRRIVHVDRKEKMKDMNPDNASNRHQNETLINTNHPNEMTLDVTDISAQAAAQRIIDAVKTAVKNHG